uniref:G_PROTEIN_RECEP_F1_2 domain-containing protein n=1 Tax=Ascaris lumbricoides TaxID=6252 RepID=A0A0M3I1G9_ASCLU
MLENLLIALLYIIMNTIALVAGIIIIAAIILEHSLRRSQCYQMMLYICILDTIQAFIALISGFLTIWPLKNELSTKFLWILSMLIAAAFFVVFLTPNVTMRYDPSTYTWRYVRSSEAFVVAMTEACSLTPLSVISFVNYIIILFSINRKKRSHNLQMNSISSSEKRILIQSIALFSLTTTGVFFDFFNFYLLPATKWMYFMLNLIRQTCIVMVPLLNLLFNVSLRMKALEFIKYAGNRLWGSPTALRCTTIASTNHAATKLGTPQLRNQSQLPNPA